MCELPPPPDPIAPIAPPVPPEPLLAASDALVEELRTATPAALERFDAEAIHKARVATRRLSAVMELIKPLASRKSRKAFSGSLRKLRRRLGALRDLDVMLDHLLTLGADARSAAAVERLSAHLQDQRVHERADVMKKSPTHKILSRLQHWNDVRSEAFDASEAIESLLGQQLHDHLHAFDSGAMALAAPDLSQRSDPHEVRIDGKRLRYNLELAAIQGHAIESKTMRAFKKMQEELGQWHDHIVLAGASAELATHLLEKEHDANSAAAMYDLSARTLKIAAKHLDGFSQRWANRGESISATIRAAFPLTRDLNKPQTDPDLPSLAQTTVEAEPAPAISEEPPV